jgi:4a-hydroxytetrahydrobiopterin dehydratase
MPVGQAIAGLAAAAGHCGSVGATCQGGRMENLSTKQILDAGLGDWRKLAQGLHARYRIADFSAGAGFAAAVAEVAKAASHYPDLKIANGAVDVSLCTREDGLWVTEKDIDMARKISEIAWDNGFEAEPAAVAQLEIALDTAHEEGVGPFWSALLTGSPDNKIYDSVFDPAGRVPSLWFQGTDEHEAPRQRWHFDLWLAPEAAEERIAAAVAAGGSVVDDSAAPSYTVLADPDGNRVCVCTCLDRGLTPPGLQSG